VSKFNANRSLVNGFPFFFTLKHCFNTETQLTAKGKKAEQLYSALHGTNHFKALRHGSHHSACKEHHACLSFVSVHQMAPPLNVMANI